MSDNAIIPEHFVPTSTHPRWRGKLKCAYCVASGWPNGNWMEKHGADCYNSPVTPRGIVQTILDDCLDVDYGWEHGEEYTSIRGDTAERIIKALTEADWLKEK